MAPPEEFLELLPPVLNTHFGGGNDGFLDYASAHL